MAEADTLRTYADIVRSAVNRHFRLWLAVTLGTPAVYVAGMLAALVIRFGDLPNYWTLYNWPANVIEIVRSTPAVSDMVPIILDEWLLEVGFMNYDYGLGIAEWSMNVQPAKLLIVLFLGALLGTVLVLAKRDVTACSPAVSAGARTTAGLGAGMVAMTSLTMTWVVCCATPSWVVGLAMLGVGVSTALWLEWAGPWLSFIGFALLIGTGAMLVRKQAETIDKNGNQEKRPAHNRPQTA